MSYILFARQENEHINSDDMRDEVFAFDVDYNAVIEQMSEALDTTSTCNFTFYIFADGKRISPDQTDECIALATTKAKERQEARNKAFAEETKRKAEETALKYEASQRALYEKLKLKFEGVK